MVQILGAREDLKELDRLRGDRPLVLVPTMGALHAGHLSLVRLAAERGSVVVSIFVNPAQFAPGEDLDNYPRDLDRDLDLLRPLGIDAVFAPDVEAMYGSEGEVTVEPGQRARGLCGAARPGHFRGVLTVVAKLFGLIRPEVAVFGRKDAQQFLVIAQMVRDLCLPVTLVDAPTVREPDGLAMSSRNRYLKGRDRERALCLAAALHSGKRLIENGERDVQAVEKAMADGLVAADRIDYAAVRSVPELEEPGRIFGRVLLAVAAQVGPARLIDNIVLDVNGQTVAAAGLVDSRPDAQHGSTSS